VEQLLAMLTGGPADGSARVAVIVGPAGVGKSALAVQVAHRLRPAFPDGQLYASLGGAGAMPVGAHDIQGRFMRALGLTPAEVPPPGEERTALYRSALAARSLLIVLDDMADAAQIQDLLPGAGGSVVLATSRNEYYGPAGAGVVPLPMMSFDESRALLGHVIGPDRLRAEAGAVAAVLDRCAGLPLAIRIVGARLLYRPTWSVSSLAERLRQSERTLDELSIGELSVRASLALGYAGLSSPLARGFRLLGASGLTQFDAGSAGALLGTDPDRAEQLLEGLARCCLLDVPHEGRYRFHDLTLRFAEEMAASVEPAAARALALKGLTDRYLALAEAAAEPMRPGGHPSPLASGTLPWPADAVPFTGYDQSVEWFEQHAAALAALSRRVWEQAGADAFCWRIAEALRPFFILTRPWEDMLRVFDTGLAAAEDAGEQLAVARMRDGLAVAHLDLGRVDEAARGITAAIPIYRTAGRSDLEAKALSNLTGVLVRQGRHQEGMEAAERALAIQLAAGEDGTAAVTLSNMGMLQVAVGDHAGALGNYLRALELSRSSGHHYAEAAVLSNLGEVYLALDRPEESLQYCAEALERCDALGTAHGRALTLVLRSRALARLRRTAESRAALAEALETLERLAAPEAAAIRTELDGLPA
jgi:tetratricopeptide (TPR) repeat protein